MNILFLTPYPLKEAPSQRFRFEQYFKLLHENGHQISYQSFWDLKTWGALYKHGNWLKKITGFTKGSLRRLIILFRLSKIDFVYVHRECLPIGPPIIEWIIAKVFKKKIIYDFDDAIWLPNTSLENKLVSALKFHNKVNSICKWSYKISCGNSFLADYASQFNKYVIVNPTTIDTLYLHNPSLYTQKRESPQITIGWTGTHSTLPYLETLVPVIKRLERVQAIRFIVIADRKPDFITDTLEFIQWNRQTEIKDLMQFDIGIMPLTDDIWAKGKCGFKALQYMALEIPAVVSPVGASPTIIEHGVDGFLCQNENDWLQTLTHLVQDYELRKRIGKKGREKVERFYSVRSNAFNFLRLFS